MDTTQTTQMPSISEPPPLLATNFNEPTPSATQEKRCFGLLMGLCSEVAAKGRQHEAHIAQLETRFAQVKEQERRDHDDMSRQLNEVQRLVQAASAAIEHNLLYIPALLTAVQHISQTRGEITTNSSDAITTHCQDAINALQGFSTGGVLPHQPLPGAVIDCLHTIGRSDVAALNLHPSPALLAYCYATLGRVAMKSGLYSSAEGYFLQGLKADDTSYPGSEELAHCHQQARDMQVEEEQPVTPRSRSTSPIRQHFFTPPPARSISEIEGDLPRGAVTPGTGHWNTDTSSPYLSFPRPWATESPSPVAAPPPRPKVTKQCYNCKATQNLKMCSGCKKVCFCSVECQKSAWDLKHSEECEGMGNTIGASSITA